MLLQCGAAMAQTGQAQIVGTIKDSSGEVVPLASVTAINERNGMIRAAEANERGYFVIPGLQPSTYTVKASSTQPINAVTLRVYVCHLRKRLEPFGLNIKTLISVGYCLCLHQNAPGTPGGS